MALLDDVPIDQIPELLRGLVVLGVAAWIFLVRPRAPAHITLGLAVAFEGAQSIASVAERWAGSVEAVHAWARTSVLISSWEMLALLAFLVVFPVRRGPRRLPWAFAGLGVLFLAIEVLRPDLFATFGATAGDQALTTTSSVSAVALGPLFWNPLFFQAEAIVAITLAIAWRRQRDGDGRSLMLLATAFAAPTLYMGMDGLVFSALNPVSDGPLASTSARAFILLMNGMAAFIGLIAAILLTFHHGVSKGRLTIFATALVSGAAIGALVPTNAWYDALYGVLGIAFPLLIAFAIIRMRVLGTDAKFNFTVKSGTLAAIFVTVIFAVSEGAQVLFGDEQPWLGVAAGAALIFALAPLQRFAESVANRAVPDAKPIVAMSTDEKTMAFEEVVRMAWADGQVSPAERLRLDAARSRLGLSESKAAAVERGVLEAIS